MRAGELPKDDIGKLVYSYKTLKGIPHDNALWNKLNYGRCAKSAKYLLDICADLRTADACLLDLAGKFDDQEYSWTFETIVRHAFDWITKKKGPTDAKTRARQGLFDAIAKQRSAELGSGGGGNHAAGTLPDASGNLHAIPGPTQENNHPGRGSQHERLLEPVLETLQRRREPLAEQPTAMGSMGPEQLQRTITELAKRKSMGD